MSSTCPCLLLIELCSPDILDHLVSRTSLSTPRRELRKCSRPLLASWSPLSPLCGGVHDCARFLADNNLINVSQLRRPSQNEDV
ncbi:hypothetical protein C8R44DRAFT_978076, partial [Mycena epipterygia]